MKFWTTDSSCPDMLVVDMVQCDECDRWLPPENMELHLLYHKHQQENTKHDCDDGVGAVEDDASLPAFVMETIPCEDCQVLVPKNNWEIHRAHVCRGRRGEYENAVNLQTLPLENDPPLLPFDDPVSNSIACTETVECDTCGMLVPLHNLELHLARACTALHGPPVDPYDTNATTEEPTLDSPTRGDDDIEEWECPRCTYMNNEMTESQSDWKCRMCNYSLAIALEEEDHQPTTGGEKYTQKTAPSSWQNFVTSWVPREYHQLLLDKNNIKTKKGKKKRPRKPQRQRRPAPLQQQTPPQWELRDRRNNHLTMLERERQQYLQLLRTTRQEQQTLNQRMTEKESMGDSTTDDGVPSNSGLLPDDNTTNGPQHHPPQPSSADQQQQASPTQQQLLQATEQLCLHHLEELRRTNLIQELAFDIALLGLPRWKRHLFHLMDLYQSASELYVDNIIWEIRMHFSYYATLEVMALLEMKVWKEQITKKSSLQLEENDAPQLRRRACRNERDISIICQSVLPFLGRPQTRALRAM